MVYNIDWLKEEYEKAEKLNYFFLWGHKPHKDGMITSSCLSQWWICDFNNDGIKFLSTELENGTDLRYIQELLEHSSSRKTEIYTHVSTKNLQQIRTPFDDL